MSSRQVISAIGDQSAEALIELLIAVVCGLVVSVALFSILQNSLHAQHRIYDYGQADNAGRSAIATIVEELHSTCTGFTARSRGIQAPAAVPVAPLEATGRTSIWFITSYGTHAPSEPLPSASEQELVWKSTGETNTHEPLGELVDYTFASSYPNGGTEPAFAQGTAKLEEKGATRRLLATDITPPLVEGKRDIFRYYRYKTNPEDGELESKPMSPPFTSGEPGETGESAREVAKVTITFEQSPADGQAALGQAVTVSDSVSLRFGPTEAPIGRKDTPCA